MALDSCLLEIHSARLYFALSPQGWCPQTPPPFPQWATPRPLPIHAPPTYRPLLGTEARPAVEASPVAIGAMAAGHRRDLFWWSSSPRWTIDLVHPFFPR